MVEKRHYEQTMSPVERALYLKKRPEKISTNTLRGLSQEDKNVLLGCLLNNFYQMCPGGINRTWKKVVGVKVRRDRRPLGRDPKPVGMSERRYRETNGQFFAAIDAAIEASGLSREVITTMNRRLKFLSNQLNKTLDKPKERATIYAELEPLRQKLEEQLLLVYKELSREYTDTDLTA